MNKIFILFVFCCLLNAYAEKDTTEEKQRFSKQENGIIKDSDTKLEWYVGENQDTNLDDAKKWIKTLNTSNFNNVKWRLPSIEELKNIYEKGKDIGNISALFAVNKTMFVWSNSSGVRKFGFSDGSPYWAAASSSMFTRVFAVNTGIQPEKKEDKKNNPIEQEISKQKVLIEQDLPEKVKTQRFSKQKNNVIKDAKTGLEWCIGKNEDLDYDVAQKWINSLNDKNFANLKWRLPSLVELQVICETNNGEKSLDPLFLIGKKSVWSNKKGAYPNIVYFVDMGKEGKIYLGNKKNIMEKRVFAVSDKNKKIIQQKRFSKSENAIIRDANSELEWYVQKERKNWNDAKKWIEDLNNKNFANAKWRLPSIKELENLYEKDKGNVHIDLIFSDIHQDVWSNEPIHSGMRFYNFLNNYAAWNPRGYPATVFAVREKNSNKK